MVWVYGTSGSPEENAVVMAKVRYDAQVWAYRSSGTATIVPDHEYNPDKFAGRNVILYGNMDMNSAFQTLLADCPIQINREKIQIGQEAHEGDLGIYFTYPLAKSDDNLVGVIGATSVKAMRASLQARYFVSGVACPDYAVFGLDVLSEGMSGILKAGYFDNEWKLSE